MNEHDVSIEKVKREFPPFKELPLSHFFMFGQVMRRENICKIFLEQLLQKKIAKIEFINREHDLSDEFNWHGIRLDVYLEDKDNTRYDIEMQRTDQKGLERRVRYYQSGIDRAFLEKNTDYDELGESYIIFVCDFDYYGKGLACYERQSIVKDCPGLEYNDGSHAIFLNTKYTDANVSIDMKEFLDYIRTNDDSMLPKGELTTLAKKYVNDVRHDETKEGPYMTMAQYRLDSLKEGRAEGRAEGRQEKDTENVLNIWHLGKTVEEISVLLRLDKDYIESIIKAAEK